jgi:hypothetical protein
MRKRPGEGEPAVTIEDELADAPLDPDFRPDATDPELVQWYEPPSLWRPRAASWSALIGAFGLGVVVGAAVVSMARRRD